MTVFNYRMTQLHSRLDDYIRAETRRRMPDALKLFRLNRLRLRVKKRLQTAIARPQLA